jgi:hypothetical protein
MEPLKLIIGTVYNKVTVFSKADGTPRFPHVTFKGHFADEFPDRGTSEVFEQLEDLVAL